MKFKNTFAVILIVFLVVSFLFKFKSKKEAKVKNKIEYLICQIDSFRTEHSYLPNSLCSMNIDVFEEKLNTKDTVPISVFYLKQNETDYYLWVDSILCSPVVYNSDGRKWSSDLPKPLVHLTEKNLVGTWKYLTFNCAQCNDCSMLCINKDGTGEHIESSGELIYKINWKLEKDKFYFSKLLKKDSITEIKNTSYYFRIFKQNETEQLTITSTWNGSVYSLFRFDSPLQ